MSLRTNCPAPKSTLLRNWSSPAFVILACLVCRGENGRKLNVPKYDVQTRREWSDTCRLWSQRRNRADLVGREEGAAAQNLQNHPNLCLRLRELSADMPKPRTTRYTKSVIAQACANTCPIASGGSVGYPLAGDRIVCTRHPTGGAQPGRVTSQTRPYLLPAAVPALRGDRQRPTGARPREGSAPRNRPAAPNPPLSPPALPPKLNSVPPVALMRSRARGPLMVRNSNLSSLVSDSTGRSPPLAPSTQFLLSVTQAPPMVTSFERSIPSRAHAECDHIRANTSFERRPNGDKRLPHIPREGPALASSSKLPT